MKNYRFVGRLSGNRRKARRGTLTHVRVGARNHPASDKAGSRRHPY